MAAKDQQEEEELEKMNLRQQEDGEADPQVVEMAWMAELRSWKAKARCWKEED